MNKKNVAKWEIEKGGGWWTRWPPAQAVCYIKTIWNRNEVVNFASITYGYHESQQSKAYDLRTNYFFTSVEVTDVRDEGSRGEPSS